MRVGLIPFFGWMPHTPHFIYLTHALRALGHDVAVMACNGQLETCYNIEAKGTGKRALTCAKCRFSNAFVSAQTDQRATFQNFSQPVPLYVAPAPTEWVYSSLRTLHRIEGDEQLSSLAQLSQANKLVQASGRIFDSVQNWCRQTQLDFVFLFNGRMDITRAALEALKQNNVPFASVERSFAGHGINILPNEDCLGLKAVHRLTKEARDTPLPHEQAFAAGKFLFDRLKGQTTTEWRNYQQDATVGSWPLQVAGPRILILPSSMNEVEGSSDYLMDWTSPAQGYEATIAAAGATPDQVVVRGHPNWAQNIGISLGDKISHHYVDWTKKQGYHYIDAHSKVRTADLMRDADLILVSHSSAAFEAGAVGRDIINVGTAHYSKAGFAHNASTPARLAQVMHDMDLHRSMKMTRLRQRRLLRYIHTASHRIPMFSQTIVPRNSRHCDLYKPHDFKRLTAILAGEPLALEPLIGPSSTTAEDEALSMLDGHTWPDMLPSKTSATLGRSWPAYRGKWLLDATRRVR